MKFSRGIRGVYTGVDEGIHGENDEVNKAEAERAGAKL